MTWPIDKLGLINQQLSICGDNNVAAADDGSDEWTVCSAAYENAFEYALDNADWKQCTTVAILNPTTAILAGAIQELKADNDNLRTCMGSWRCRIFGWR